MKNFSWVLIFLILLSCDGRKAKQRQERIHNIHNQVLVAENELQQQLSEVLELQMNDSVMLVNDTGNVHLQQQIDSMERRHEELKTIIDKARDTVKNLDELSGKRSLRDASLALLNSYDDIVKNEYSMIMQLIKLPDTAYNRQKRKAYLSTTHQLNRQLNKAVEEYNSAREKFVKEYDISIEKE